MTSVTLVRPVLPCYFEKALADIGDAVQAEDADPAPLKALTAGWSEKAGPQEFWAVLRGVFEELEADIHMKKDVATSGWSYEMTFRYTGPPLDPAARRPRDQIPPDTVRASKLPARARPPEPTQPAPPPVPQVSLRMLAPAEDIMGMDVPRDLARQEETRLLITRTTDVTVRLPGDKTFRQRVKAAEFHVRQGVVFKVFLTPQVLATSYRETVAELLWVSNANAIAPKGQVNQQIAAWPGETDRSVRRASEALNEKLRFVVAMLPKDDGKWRPLFAFVATGDPPKTEPAPNSEPVSKAAAPPGTDE